ncbi:hypothetical protein G7046_g5771 [Stylonectria norvegica]|nr:hypothetical protein G7046_g5771 [Stylonectria norvegica]
MFVAAGTCTVRGSYHHHHHHQRYHYHNKRLSPQRSQATTATTTFKYYLSLLGGDPRSPSLSPPPYAEPASDNQAQYQDAPCNGPFSNFLGSRNRHAKLSAAAAQRNFLTGFGFADCDSATAYCVLYY